MSGKSPVILRPGAITLEMISEVLDNVSYDACIDAGVDKPKCPGMKYKHYSPKADVEVVMGEGMDVKRYIESKLCLDANCGVLSFFGHDYDNAVCVLRAGNNMSEYASGLFYNLRVFDEYNVSKIYAEFSETNGIGIAVKNRLFKAAGNKITKV